jgi:hypothetical protein
VVQRGLALLEDALSTTHAIGGKYLVGALMSALKKYPGPCSAAARKNVVKSLKVRSSVFYPLCCTPPKKVPGLECWELVWHGWGSSEVCEAAVATAPHDTAHVQAACTSCGMTHPLHRSCF